MADITKQLRDSLERSFINEAHPYIGHMKPRLISNQKDDHMLNTILEELHVCQGFQFSVAFITESGLTALKSKLWDLHLRGVQGQILTSTYLTFNQPKIFRELMKIPNLKVRTTSLSGFHSKGYIFEHTDYSSLIVGSSNLTINALKTNYEWNMKVTSYHEGEIIHHFKQQFAEVWDEAEPLTEDWITRYEAFFNEYGQSQQHVAEFPQVYANNPIHEALSIQPNKMQKAALHGLHTIREKGAKRGLIVSATGTGKTFLSAFDVRGYQPNQFLFIAHREQILQKAKEEFQRILGGPDRDFGILSGNQADSNAKYVFATIQSISRDDTLHSFKKDHFDYILIDEVHKAGAPTYQKLVDYFDPDFLMGMTATPERSDDFNIFDLFHYNIAYEIRLQDALEEDMLCPFQYFGVTDIDLQTEGSMEAESLAHVSIEERAKHMLQKIEYYGHSGEERKGLIFASRKKEAQTLSDFLNDRGYETVSLTGEDSQDVRLQQVDRLENGALDYIITVDVFNEGVDIPSVNQIVMMRQTESSIIFIQQLGRGLRKSNNKDFVTVIDFIGNYKKNYLIPIALSGDQTLNKDNVRRYMRNANFIQGLSTVNFEEVAKEQVYRAIDDGKFKEKRMLKEAYQQLTFRLGRQPLLRDFYAYDSIDPEVLVDKYKSNYHDFLVQIKATEKTLTANENGVLSMVSQELLAGKRKHELLLLQKLLQTSQGITEEEFASLVLEHGCQWNEATKRSVERMLTLEFLTETERGKYQHIPLIKRTAHGYQLGEKLARMLNENDWFQTLVYDALDVGLLKNEAFDCTSELTLYKKYTRKDVVRLLNWENNESGVLFGHKTKHQTCPIFINYKKGEDLKASIKYEDELLSPTLLQWYSRNRETLNTKRVRDILEADKNGVDIHIFVKKSDDEGVDSYYLGRAFILHDQVFETIIKEDSGEELPSVSIQFQLEHPVDTRLYQYIVE
ncbi:DUF3427 domain-containing protein [Salisediminibacterium halotolerans]|uniref:DUF3427 domain-containing protein n=1 Tax=Salisediminibacterium halotolerans TaxID=517425 RepID=UPI000EB26D5B|nr:DEAD/DEAH box helicase [Salisediminibacterium halotolerans]RLJ78316.1 superfamily II DNA or RNA helicase [Actinophytocola xinjiangensis]RPE88345.1 superfamily II DNA or RNA helicase [Salisediminibacterium halotolerans]TWG37292.1 superfamily II DNA or RNA helicase [Salisediminibacterium halotolerans]GEL08756.1 helicase [Salisediminibacterium halotolerans]